MRGSLPRKRVSQSSSCDASITLCEVPNAAARRARALGPSIRRNQPVANARFTSALPGAARIPWGSPPRCRRSPGSSARPRDRRPAPPRPPCGLPLWSASSCAAGAGTARRGKAPCTGTRSRPALASASRTSRRARAGGAAGFLGEDGVVGIGPAHGLDDRLLGGAIDLRDEVVHVLHPDRKRAAVERGAVDDRAGAPGGAYRDVEHRGHGGLLVGLGSGAALCCAVPAIQGTSAPRRAP